MSKSQLMFLVLDGEANPVALEDSAEAARDIAYRRFDEVTDETGGEDGVDAPRSNPRMRRGGRGEATYSSGRRVSSDGPSLILSSAEAIREATKKSTGWSALKATGLPQVSEEEVLDLTDGLKNWKRVRDLALPVLKDTGLAKRLMAQQVSASAVSNAMLGSNYKMSKGKKNKFTCPSCSIAPKRAKDEATGKYVVTTPGKPVYMEPVAPSPWTIRDPSIEAVRCPQCGVTSRLGTVRGLVLTPYWYGLQALDNIAKKFGPDAPPGEFFGTAEKNEQGLKEIIYPINDAAVNAGFYEKGYDRSKLKSWVPPLYHLNVPQDAEGRQTGPATYDMEKRWASNANLCAGSSLACRATCLVLSGQQLTNFGVKLALTKLLYEQPVAFCALLTLAVQGFFGPRTSGTRFIRLNVVSDVPFEAFYPALFDLAPESARLYDYTKVRPLTRDIPDNYDLTLSFNGTNWADCKEHLERGYRVACVFAPLDPKLKGDRPDTRLKGLPDTFQGYKVIDGDGDDMRALDVAHDERGKGVIVGLRYKRPKKVLESAEKKSRFREGFVVPVAMVEGRLIAAHTPKHDPVEFHDEDEAKMLGLMAEHEEYGIDKERIVPARARR